MTNKEELDKKLTDLIESKQDKDTQESIFKELIKQGLNINKQDDVYKTPY